jgi:hypothetical protein
MHSAVIDCGYDVYSILYTQQSHACSSCVSAYKFRIGTSGNPDTSHEFTLNVLSPFIYVMQSLEDSEK